MKKLEDYIEKKIYDLVNYLLLKKIKPDFYIDRVTYLNQDGIKKIKEQYNIEGIILDVDDTLRKDMKTIPKCNEEWLDMIRKELKVIIVTNGIDGKVRSLMNEKGIEYIGFAHKPLKKNFLKACEKMNLKPENVLVIGDSVLDDIYGGNRNNMKTALVREVEEEER